MSSFDPTVWGPHYWFFLHTITLSYPKHPNAISKKKTYDFIQNIPLFIPNENISSYFSNLLDKYPVTPYLDSRDSFVRWMHFIHNKVNQKLEKPVLSLNAFYKSYYEEYKPKDIRAIEYYKTRGKLVYGVIILVIICCIYYGYMK
jgi:hypothetical protein